MRLDRTAAILIVDDFSTMRRIVCRSLRKLGFENFTEAENGQSAWQALREGEFGLVISDWNMPGVSGLQLLNAMRSNPRLREVPFLMVTAETKRDNIVQAVQAGVNGYIAKPFNGQKLAEKLDTIFEALAA